MQQMAGVKVHPALEPFFALVIELKNKTGAPCQAANVAREGVGRAVDVVRCLRGITE
jgi:hypothetical protein